MNWRSRLEIWNRFFPWLREGGLDHAPLDVQLLVLEDELLGLGEQADHGHVGREVNEAVSLQAGREVAILRYSSSTKIEI